MSENVLKKDFKSADVQRLRNLMTGKQGERTTAGVGYSKQQEFHNEGDIWEEDGRQWTIKNGIKQNLTKLDKAKKLVVMPLFCPCCSNLMKKRNDKLFYIQYNRCCDVEKWIGSTKKKLLENKEETIKYLQTLKK